MIYQADGKPYFPATPEGELAAAMFGVDRTLQRHLFGWAPGTILDEAGHPLNEPATAGRPRELQTRLGGLAQWLP